MSLSEASKKELAEEAFKQAFESNTLQVEQVPYGCYSVGEWVTMYHDIQEKDVVKILMAVIMASCYKHTIQIIQKVYTLSDSEIVRMFFHLVTDERTYHSQEYQPTPFSRSTNYFSQEYTPTPHIQYCTHYMYTIPGSDYIFYFVYHEGNRYFTITSEKHFTCIYEDNYYAETYDEVVSGISQIPLYKCIQNLESSNFSEEAVDSMLTNYPNGLHAIQKLLKLNFVGSEPFSVCVDTFNEVLQNIVVEDIKADFAKGAIGL